jgi:hypothetical protein
MLKKPCPYHKTPVNHTLEQCDMLKRFFGRAAAKDDEAKKDRVMATLAASPLWKTSSSSSGGRPSTCRAASASGSGTRFSPPSFLDWSEDAITFSREDHPNRIPNPG